MKFFEIPSPKAPQNDESYITRADRISNEKEKEESSEDPAPSGYWGLDADGNWVWVT